MTSLAKKQPEPGLLATVLPKDAKAEPAWLRRKRDKARKQLWGEGFPTRRDEAWRFTSVGEVVDCVYLSAPRPDAFSSEALLDVGAVTVCVRNGWIDPSSIQQIPGMRVQRLHEALSGSSADLVEACFGGIAQPHPFGALNTALFDEALVITVGGAIERRLHLAHRVASDGSPRASYPRVLVLAEPGSVLRLLETFESNDEGLAMTSSVTECLVSEGACLEHVRVVSGGPRATHIGLVSVRQEARSRYTNGSVTVGGALSRVETHIDIAGEGAECALDGVYVADDGEHVDHQTRVRHLAPRGSSRQSYRGVLLGRGRAVFDGTIVVGQGAQQTSAHQENHNLLLSDDAVVNTKPHLRIDADDVRCSHGATIGSLDEDQLFYLRARGIDQHEARSLLTYAFARQSLDAIGDAPLRDALARMLTHRLSVAVRLEEERL